MDITYIPMARGFVYLAAVLDWATRRVLTWRLSITMEAAFCVETWRMLWRVTASRIVNTDQGSQFTGAAYKGEVTSTPQTGAVLQGNYQFECANLFSEILRTSNATSRI